MNMKSLAIARICMVFFLTCMVFSMNTAAQTDQAKSVETTQTFGDYTVHFSVFNSTFVSPDVAKLYNLTRGNKHALVNISVTKTTSDQTSLGLPAEVSGTATNMIQQQTSLDFKTISEGEATYYIAALRHTNEELIKFSVDVQPEGVTRPFSVSFSRTLHVEK